jgi:CRP-like cAMP-binding protein
MFIPGNSILFEDLSLDQIERLITCLDVRQKQYTKGSYLIREGDRIESIGFVLTGSVQVARNDFDGNRIIQAVFGPGAVFAETFVCAGIQKSPVSVVAIEDATILFIPFSRLLQTCGQSCIYHTRLIHNMVSLLARKNLLLNSKIELASRRTIREKLILYLAGEKKKANTDPFTIPFNRNELADYLCVDRSALSRELSKMRTEGIISYDRNNFSLSGIPKEIN